jgi:hypothetical protein
MYQYEINASFGRIAIDITGVLPESERGSRYLLIDMDYITKWPEVYGIRNQNASTAGDVVSNSFCHLGVPRELHSVQRPELQVTTAAGSYGASECATCAPRLYIHR